MAAHGHRRQVLLFLVAIILPCTVLVVLGLRMLAQDRELREKRLADERQAIAIQLRQELSARLDRIALTEATTFLADTDRAGSRGYGHPAVVLVAGLAAGQFMLPWERDPQPTRFRHMLDQGEFARLVDGGERAELGARSPQEAVSHYGDALAAARSPAQRTYARLLRGRARMAAGFRSQAVGDYAAVLGAGSEVVDEHGVPLALYAAARLLELGVEREAIADCVRRTVTEARWLSPSALYLLRDLDARLRSLAESTANTASFGPGERIATRLAHAEQAMALRRDLPQLGLAAEGPRIRSDHARWVPYGRPTWLVGQVEPVGADRKVVVAVASEGVFDVVESHVSLSSGVEAHLAVASPDEADGQPLGAAFPGVVVRFGTLAGMRSPDADMRRWFYAVALALVVSVTLFGAYLVVRDVRRELQLADMRSRFVSAVSHELKTPLTAIRMFAETLQLGRSSSPEMQTEYLDTIVNESERLTRLLNNVLDFSKIERGKKEYRLIRTDLADIVRASARAMRYPLEQQRLTLGVEIEEGLPPASVDRDAIEQAILNLLANAMKYSGGNRAIALRLRRADGRAVIEVEDHGVGIDPTELHRIFQQFYRVPSRDNEGIPGTGLGLTLVRHIAEGHGGRVTVASVPGRGSTFAMHLPLGDGAA